MDFGLVWILTRKNVVYPGIQSLASTIGGHDLMEQGNRVICLRTLQTDFITRALLRLERTMNSLCR